jgi:hypothetical protein
METLLDTFPFSRLWQPIHLVVRGVSHQEATLLEDSFAGVAEMDRLKAAIASWTSSDICIEVEARWDLFSRADGDWKLAPARVVLSSFGPDFEDADEDLRIDLGHEAPFVPEPDSPGGFRPVESNIRSLLKLVRDLETGLRPALRRLWSESGENIAERLAALTSGS